MSAPRSETEAAKPVGSARPAGPAVVPSMLGQLLLARGLLSEEQLAEGCRYQKTAGRDMLLGEVLAKLGYVTEEHVAEALADSYRLPFVRICPQLVDPRAVALLPREFLDANTVLPMFHVDNRLTIAMCEPTNVFLIEEIERLTRSKVQIVMATAGDIREALRTYTVESDGFALEDIVEQGQIDDLSIVAEQTTELADLEKLAGQSPVVKLVNHLICQAVQEGASDIHIEPDDGRLRVRLRIDGRLIEKLTPPQQMSAGIASRIKIMADLDIAERRLPQDGDIHVMLNGRKIDLRVSTMPGSFGEKVAIRVVDESSGAYRLDALGFSGPMAEALSRAVSQPHGIILVTGPTGSGKSTTLYAMLSEVNGENVNISTIEDPIERNVLGINQFATNERAGFTFARALRALLRQDPDVIMVGEIRDAETARIATQAALTGHLVLSTVHTNDAPSAVTRLADMGVEPFLISASLRSVLAQRLVSRICAHCKDEAEPTPAERETLDAYISGITTIYQGLGCGRCNGTGYKGRVGIYELFTPDEAISELISRGASLQELRRAARESGLVSLRADGVRKVAEGLTTVQEVLRATAV